MHRGAHDAGHRLGPGHVPQPHRQAGRHAAEAEEVAQVGQEAHYRQQTLWVTAVVVGERDDRLAFQAAHGAPLSPFHVQVAVEGGRFADAREEPGPVLKKHKYI